MTLSTAARRYGRSQSWISTLENGLHSIDPLELADLLDFYGVTDPAIRESLLHLATHDLNQNWQRIREGRISAAAYDLASLEADAAEIRNYEPNIVPGLAQLPSYTADLIAVGPRKAARNAKALVEFRMLRQKVLHLPDPPFYQPIISEAVLHNQVGSPAAMAAQLRGLAQFARMGNVDLRVLPFSAGAYLWLAGPFHLLTLRPPGDITVSVTEEFAKSKFVVAEKEVAEHREAFDRILAASMNRTQSLELLEGLASEP